MSESAMDRLYPKVMGKVLAMGEEKLASDMQSDFDKFIASKVAKAVAQIETACEQALLTGKCGVRVTHRQFNLYDTGIKVEVTDEVPYGTIEEIVPEWEEWMYHNDNT